MTGEDSGSRPAPETTARFPVTAALEFPDRPVERVSRDPGTNRTMRAWLDDNGERYEVPGR